MYLINFYSYTNLMEIFRVWISSENVGKVASKGLRFIHAASDYFYLDCGGGGWLGNNINGNSWCDPFKTWQKAYSFDPTNGTTPDQEHLVLGGPYSPTHTMIVYFINATIPR
jgi:hexosaminidase